MKTVTILFAMLLCVDLCFAQISYKQGYYVYKQGTKTECYIQDLGWSNAPTSINYRLSETGETQKIDTDKISEFAFPGVKYIRAGVQYDRSTQDIKSIGVTSNPDWAQGDLLLKVIVDGKAKLYHYNVKDYSLFFFSVDGSPIEQLVFKNYLKAGDNTQMLANRMYLSQLNTRVKCDDKAPVTERLVPYQIKPLTKHFKDFNICSGDAPTEEAAPAPKSFSIRVTPGVNFMSVSSKDNTSSRSWDFGGDVTFRAGVDLEFTLPFQKGKWAIVAEPNYYGYKGESFISMNNNSTIDIRAIEFPIGIRHKFFLSQKNFIFVNALGLLVFPVKHEQFYRIPGNAVLASDSKGFYGSALGAGLAIGRFSLEGRYYPVIDRTGEAISVGYKYNKSSIILGFRIY